MLSRTDIKRTACGRFFFALPSGTHQQAPKRLLWHAQKNGLFRQTGLTSKQLYPIISNRLENKHALRRWRL